MSVSAPPLPSLLGSTSLSLSPSAHPVLRGKRALPERAESETRSSVGPSSLRSLLGFSHSLSRLSDPPRSGAFFQPAGKPRILGLTDGLGLQRGGDRLGWALPSSAALEKPGRRPAVCAQPPAGLRPGLPIFSRKMDGFTGSLGKSRPPLAPYRSPGHLSCSGETVRATRVSGGFTRVTAVFITDSAPPLRRLQGHNTNSPSGRRLCRV